MAIVRIDNPLAFGAGITVSEGYTRQNSKMDYLGRLRFVWPIQGSNVVKGALFNIQGVLYTADSDTAITGTSSDFVKITPSGATATASYVASLAGVSWSDSHLGYYDASDNLYVFDERKAVAAGTLSVLETEYGFLFDDAWFNGAVKMESSLTVDGATTLNALTQLNGDISTDVNIPSKAMKCRKIPARIKTFLNTDTEDTVHDYFAGFMDVGEEITANGHWSTNSLIYIERTSSTVITAHIITSSGGLGTKTFTDGTATQIGGTTSFTFVMTVNAPS